MKIGNVNIRPCSDPAFWGKNYTTDLYISHGAKLQTTRRDMYADKTQVLPDLFSTRDGASSGSNYCRSVYYRILPFLAKTLNKIHAVNYPTRFWQIVFGYWLFRHIGIVYDKFVHLEMLDFETIDLILLDSHSFYVPRDHHDYFLNFCNNLGVMQLITQYFDLYSKTNYSRISKTNPLLNSNYKPNPLRHLTLATSTTLDSKDFIQKEEITTLEKENPEIVLHGIHIESQFKTRLLAEAQGRILFLRTPEVIAQATTLQWDHRAQFIEFDNDPFMKYLCETLRVSIPQIFVEYFRDYHDIYLEHIKRSKFSHIVSEYWGSFIPVSIYLAIASQQSRKIVIMEHGASFSALHQHGKWFEIEASDYYISTGWSHSNPCVRQGGFSSRNYRPYKSQPEKQHLLYVSSTRVPYFYGFGHYSSNSGLVNHLELMPKFYEALPDNLKKVFCLRPRTVPYFIDTIKYWETQNLEISLATGSFDDAIQQAKLVIIDHFATSIPEILFNHIPCLILFEKNIELLADEHLHLFDELNACGVVHHTAESAANFAAEIYDHVASWWQSSDVQIAIQKLCEKMYHPPDNTLKVLIEFLNESEGSA